MCTDNSSSCFVTKPSKEIEQELRKERAIRQHERKARMFCATGNNPVTSSRVYREYCSNELGQKGGKTSSRQDLGYFILIRMVEAMFAVLTNDG